MYPYHFTCSLHTLKYKGSESNYLHLDCGLMGNVGHTETRTLLPRCFHSLCGCVDFPGQAPSSERMQITW